MIFRHIIVLYLLRSGVAVLLLWQIARTRAARRRAEIALAAAADNEARFHAFMNHSPLISFIKDETGKVLYINEKYSEVFQRPTSDLLGRNDFERWPDGFAEKVRRHDLGILHRNRCVESIESIPDPAGRLLPWLIVKFPFAMGGRKFLGGIALNMSETDAARKALSDSEERFRAAFAHAVIGMAVTDPNGRILQVNPALCRILGYSADELPGTDVIEITHPDDRQATLEWRRQAKTTTADHVRYEKRCIRKDGSIVWTQISIGVVRNAAREATDFVVLIEDISHNREAEQQARLSDERWHLALEATNDGIWDWDATTGTVYYSARWKEMLGFEESELPNTPEIWEHLVHPDDLARAKSAVDAHLKQQSPHYMEEYRIRCKDGSWKWVLARGKAIWDAQGIPIRMIGAHADITDRKEAEERLFRQASFDSLTGLMNRGYFSSWLEKKIAVARAKGHDLSLCICDIDRFKSINDRYGHGVGDDVLINLARVLQESIRTSDLAGRLGGDEFCILLSRTSPERAAECLERIRARFQAIAFGSPGAGIFNVTASFGVAGLVPGMTSAALMEAADRALYLAKQQGRNLVAADFQTLAMSRENEGAPLIQL